MTKTTITPGTFADVIQAYLRSPIFDQLAKATRDNYRRHLVLAQKGLGAESVNTIRPALVQTFLDELTGWPGKQKCARTALQALERWAIVLDLLPRQITLGTKIKGSDGGRMPWTEAQVAMAVQHCEPHMARVVQLASATGQRVSDLCKMKWSDLEVVDGRLGINVTQQKTKNVIWVPFTRDFAAMIERWERPQMFILLKPTGRPWTARQLSTQWGRDRGRCTELVPRDEWRTLSLHGLRATAVIRLRRAGVTTAQICAMVGMSGQMVGRYCRNSDQRLDALTGMDRIDGALAANVVKFGKEGA